MIIDLWHVGLVVSDLERAVAFYGDALGLELRHRQDQANAYTAQLVGYQDASLRIAQMRLPGGWGARSGHLVELIEYVNPAPDRVESVRARIGAGHLALQVTSIADLVPRLLAAGAVLVNPPVDIVAGINKGGRAVYLTDPDGITIELVEPPAVPAEGRPTGS
jgi:catechol 2,3-dioxygenase-like lactoylglutathione lyase family enzyme